MLCGNTRIFSAQFPMCVLCTYLMKYTFIHSSLRLEAFQGCQAVCCWWNRSPGRTNNNKASLPPLWLRRHRISGALLRICLEASVDVYVSSHFRNITVNTWYKGLMSPVTKQIQFTDEGCLVVECSIRELLFESWVGMNLSNYSFSFQDQFSCFKVWYNFLILHKFKTDTDTLTQMGDKLKTQTVKMSVKWWKDDL